MRRVQNPAPNKLVWTFSSLCLVCLVFWGKSVDGLRLGAGGAMFRRRLAVRFRAGFLSALSQD